MRQLWGREGRWRDGWWWWWGGGGGQLAWFGGDSVLKMSACVCVRVSVSVCVCVLYPIWLRSEEADVRTDGRSTFPGVAAAAAAAAAAPPRSSLRLLRAPLPATPLRNTVPIRCPDPPPPSSCPVAVGLRASLETDKSPRPASWGGSSRRLRSGDVSPCSGSWLPLVETQPLLSARPFTPSRWQCVATRASVCHRADLSPSDCHCPPPPTPPRSHTSNFYFFYCCG